MRFSKTKKLEKWTKQFELLMPRSWKLIERKSSQKINQVSRLIAL